MLFVPVPFAQSPDIKRILKNNYGVGTHNNTLQM